MRTYAYLAILLAISQGCSQPGQAPSAPGAALPAKVGKSSSQALVEQAQAALKGGDIDGSLTALGKALAQDAKYVPALALRGRILSDHRKDYTGAIKDLEKAILEDPDLLETYLDRAICYRMTKQDQLALDDFDYVIKRLPAKSLAEEPSDSQLRRDVYAAYVGTGDIQDEQGKSADAISSYGQAIEVDPELSTAWASRGGVHLVQAHPEEARADIDKALSLNPSDVNALYWKVRLERNHEYGDPAAAEQWLTKLLASTKPGTANHFIGLKWRGISRLEKKEYEDGLRDLDTYLTFDEDPSVMNEIAWVLATCPENSIRNGQRAKDLAEKACRLSDWKEMTYQGTLAAACAELGDFDQAIKYQEQALADEGYAKEFEKEARQRLEGYRKKSPFRE